MAMDCDDNDDADSFENEETSALNTNLDDEPDTGEDKAMSNDPKVSYEEIALHPQDKEIFEDQQETSEQPNVSYEEMTLAPQDIENFKDQEDTSEQQAISNDPNVTYEETTLPVPQTNGWTTENFQEHTEISVQQPISNDPKVSYEEVTLPTSQDMECPNENEITLPATENMDCATDIAESTSPVHMETRTSRQRCLVCRRKFKSMDQVREHMQSAHKMVLSKYWCFLLVTFNTILKVIK